jgi:predicted lipoprotein with Yx(FWY)xxD motif
MTLREPTRCAQNNFGNYGNSRAANLSLTGELHPNTEETTVTKPHIRAALAAGALMLSASLAFAADPAMTAKTDKGDALVDAHGMTLYVFDKDSAGTTVCYDKCATNWPPFLAAADATPDMHYTLVMRKDGTHQWAYMGKPLYTWVKDTKPGDTTGDGVAGAWHIAKP